MCTFLGERAAMVCDVAIPHVRDEVEGRIPGGVSFTVAHGEGTLVQADTTVDPQAFGEAVRSGMDRVGPQA
jgi:hypothetical protein